MQAILTRYLGPTNYRSARIAASCQALRITVPYDHALNLNANHAFAAKQLAMRLDWPGRYAVGFLPNGDGASVRVLAAPHIGEAFEVRPQTRSEA